MVYAQKALNLLNAADLTTLDKVVQSQ